MARARQGQHRWHRPEWGTPERPTAAPRRWYFPLLGVFMVAIGVWIWHNPEKLPEQLRQQVVALTAEISAPAEPPGVTRSVYRWRDSYDALQFTDEPPPEGVAYVVVEVDPATNTLPAGAAPWPER